MLKTGKLDSDLLKELVFDKITYRSEAVKVRPGIGEDCAVMDFGSYECVMSTDPITAAVSDIGRLAIHITCNDIASNGVQPLGIMLAVMLPVGTDESDVAHIMGQAAETAAALNVEIIGGHTEITPAVNQPVIVSTAIGKALSGRSQSGNDIAEGDYIMMTKSVGLEGCGILACDYRQQLAEVLTEEELDRVSGFLNLVSVVAEGIAAGTVGTHGMHDITEGGILGAVWEMCQIAGKGAQVWADSIPMTPEVKKICSFFDIDPLRLISSGSMLIIVPQEKRGEIEAAMADAGVDCSVIGRIEREDYGIRLLDVADGAGRSGDMVKDDAGNGRSIQREPSVDRGIAIQPPASDEIYKVVGSK